MTTTTARTPAGVPTGGQFAATGHTEPATVLTPPDAAVVDDGLTPAQRSAAAVAAFAPAKEAFERADTSMEYALALRTQAAEDVVRTAVLEAYPDAATLEVHWHENSEATVWDGTILDADGNNIRLDDYDLTELDDAHREIVERAHWAAENIIEYTGYSNDTFEISNPDPRFVPRPSPTSTAKDLGAGLDAELAKSGSLSDERVAELLAAVRAL